MPDGTASWDDAISLCSDLGGKLFEPMTVDQNQKVFDFMRKKFGGVSTEYWTGIYFNKAAQK